MPLELKVPQVGESITEVQIGEWLKSPGDAVQADEPLVVIETDKVTVELPAPSDGRMGDVVKAQGETATVGEVIGFMEAGAPASAGTSASMDASTSEEPAASAGEAVAAAPATAGAGAAPARVMPAAARALSERGLDASEVQGTGPGGRILKEDVLRHGNGSPARAPEPPPSLPARARPPAAPTASADVSALEEIVPMSPLRRRVAERLVEAQNTAAILSTFNEIDMTAVKALRKAQGQRFLEAHGVKLGFMSFFVKAVVEALKRVPGVNGEIRDGRIVYKNHYDIGVAVGGGKGLVVPVVRGAERMSFAEVETSIADLAARARDNKLALEELQGGTFTISNGGIYGSLLSTPILNPPQSGILGLHAIQDRPVVRDGEIVVRPMMYVALSYDHRLVDGREAVTFLIHVKESLEDPARLLLEI